MPHKHKPRIPTSIKPRVKQPKINYEIIHPSIGSGAFGKVYKARNLDTGAMMAVKVVSIMDDGREIKMLRNEVEILARSNHRHIVELITSEGWSGSEIKIFMSLKEGSLASLALATSNAKLHDITEIALHHMLQALDYLASGDILHRDVKPDNILYSMVGGKPRFELGDFGLAIEARQYEDHAGTFAYMAPDVLLRGAPQTAKSDVWSLYATMLWVLDGRGFREKCLRLGNDGGPEQLFRDIVDMTRPVPQELKHIEEMAAFNANCRASAGEMLDKLFRGRGNRKPNVNPPPRRGVCAREVLDGGRWNDPGGEIQDHERSTSMTLCGLLTSTSSSNNADSTESRRPLSGWAARPNALKTLKNADADAAVGIDGMEEVGTGDIQGSLTRLDVKDTNVGGWPDTYGPVCWGWCSSIKQDVTAYW
ncbi:hypothetical protein MRS44_005683 [Fusarium solani]|uniref:uncharacterized protein n=1 Tax=Fusarium solani TaxID=169388 RepID=UPI0032C40D3E|nr:hypothetical protein MRS44_005683 [Fusarium solani]